jgi:ornithine cyclodeaminase/alanine dehydrogenase-like protein (mu-crystallin family)
VTNDGVGIYLSSVGGGDDHEHKQDEAKDRCISVGESVVDSWTKEPSEKTEVLKPKPKQRARKLRKNKKTQGKS